MRKVLVLLLVLCSFVLSGEVQVRASEDVLPAAYDLRTLGYAPAVMNQGTDQTCWTFAAMSAITSNYLMYADKNNTGHYLGNNSDLSELHMAWYSFKNVDKKKNFAFIKNGSIVENPADTEILNHPGTPQMALAFLSRNDGPVLESALPYSSSYPAAGTSPRDYKQAVRVKNATYIESLSSDKTVLINKEQMIKLALMNVGAVDIGVYWDKNYVSPNAAYYNPNSRRGGHAVTIIGWDDNYSRENFSPVKPASNGAWLVQNSWGTSWGDNGYFWISYSQEIRYAMAFETEAPNPRVREYVHDELGFTHELAFVDDNDEIVNSPVIANVFKVRGDHEKLREIGYYATNSTYIGFLAVLDLGTENSPESLQKAREDIDRQRVLVPVLSIASKGYITSTLTNAVPLSKDHYFAILESFAPLAGGDSANNEIGNFSNFAPSIAAEVQIPGYRTAYAEVNANETYVSLGSDDVFHDAKEYVFTIGDKEVTGFNACIKGFTYIPDARLPDDWTLVSADGKAQLSISLLRGAEPKTISIRGQGIANVRYKTELEDADTGGAAGRFYTLKLICDLTANSPKLTSLIIDGEEMLTGNLDKDFVKYTSASSDDESIDYVDISQIGVSLSTMTLSGSTAIESTEGYNGNSAAPGNESGSGGGSGGGCNINFGAALIAMMILIVKVRRSN